MEWKKGRTAGSGSTSFNMVPPPASFSGPIPRRTQVNPLCQPDKAKQSYSEMSGAGFLRTSGMDAVTATMQYGMNVRKQTNIDDDEFFDEDDAVPSPSSNMAYQPAPDSPSYDAAADEEDPLDSFMAEIEVQAKRDKEDSEQHEKEKEKDKNGSEGFTVKKDKLGRTDIEDEDDQESYFKWIDEHPEKLGYDPEEEEIEYDDEGNPHLRKKIIDPLPPVDHSTIEYEQFERNFYVEHDDISKLGEAEVSALRDKLGIKVSGPSPAKPVCSFAHFGFDDGLMDVIRRSEFTQPTPIQAQGIPVALAGRDIIGIAKTGSGKTAAYLWPAIVHLMDQRELRSAEGPIVLICVPTRELAIQVYTEAKKFSKMYNVRCVCAYGGGSKWEQTKALQEGAEIVICTPGRLIDHVKIGATNLQRVTYLVFDEADRMFDLGFEAQVRSIANHVRPDRQCLMFSATFKKKVERLARDVLNDPVRVVQGEVGEANQDIRQTIEVLKDGKDKWPWLTQRLVGFCALGKVLIFVTKKQNADELATNLKARDFHLGVLHGDMQQYERNDVLQQFRNNDAMKILVATDVAARGLDIPSIKTVVNYDVARDIDTHVHRIGRTARGAGQIGYAITLVSEKDKEFAGHLVRNLESVNQFVPNPLLDLAYQSTWFRKSRLRMAGKGKMPKIGIGGRGLGFVGGNLNAAGKSGASSSAIVDSGSAYGPAPGTSSVGVKNVLMNMKPGGERLSAMKTAFSAQFRSKFQAASSETSWDSHAVPVTEPTPEWKTKIEELRKHAAAANAARETSKKNAAGDSQNSERRKRSRWD